MISFFRKIRQKLLSQNKVTRYLVYAFGEIFLVVIGILMALQVNNWNESKKDNLIEHTFLLKLKSNLQDDVLLYKNRFQGNEEIYNHMDTAAAILKNYKSHTTEDLQDHLRFILFFNRFNPNKTAFENLLSSAKLDIIRNDSITEALFLYYREVSITQESLAESIDAYSRNTFGPSLMEFDFLENSVDISNKGTKSTFELKPLKSYVENPKIINHISRKMILLRLVGNAYERQMENAERIISLIDSELKSKDE